MNTMAETRPRGWVKAPSNAEKFFVVVALMLSTGAFATLAIKPGQTPNQSVGVVSLPVTGLIYLITLSLLVRHCKGFVRIFLREWPLVALAGVAMASALWSQAPALSFRHGIGLLLTFLFGVYVAIRYSIKEQLRLLAWMFGICVIFSFIFGLFGLGTSVDAGEGVPGWFGIFLQKNTLGQVMVLSALVFLFWGRAEPKHKTLASAGFLASLLLIVLSNSMTSIVAIFLLLALMPYLRWVVRKSTGWMVAGFSFLAVAGVLSLTYMATHLPEVTGLLGKSATLSGRLELWVFSVIIALRHPWLGYGYNAFWLQDHGAALRIRQAMGWMVPQAHNGFLELWLELGLCGLGIFFAGFIFYLWRALKHFVRHPVAEGGWPLVFLAFIFLLNITEVTLSNRNSIYVVLYTVVVLSTAPKSFRVRNPLTVVAPIKESPSSA